MTQSPGTIMQWPEAPSELDTDEARELWDQIVKTLPPDYFKPAEHEVVVQYILTIMSVRHHREMMKVEGDYIAGKLNRRHMILQSELKTMSSLAARLRCTPSSRMDRMIAGKAARPLVRSKHDVSPEEDQQLAKYGL